MNRVIDHANTIFIREATFPRCGDVRHCQSYFRRASIPDSSTGCKLYSPAASQHAVVLPRGSQSSKTSALTSDRSGSVSTWHGMPTALVKSKLILNWPVIANPYHWNQSKESAETKYFFTPQATSPSS